MKSWSEQSLTELSHDKKANIDRTLTLYLEEELLHSIQPQSFLTNLHRNGALFFMERSSILHASFHLLETPLCLVESGASTRD